jgi:alkylated DNA repair protein (DNA oxidative demethylase)
VDYFGCVAAAKRADSLPPGLVFVPDFVTAQDEADLISYIRSVEFRTLQMHRVTAKRRIKQFGWHYAFESFQLTPTDPIPAELAGLAERAAALAGIEPSQWGEALFTEYAPGAGIGWHRDAPAFGVVAGISLLGACRMRFQTGEGASRVTSALELPPGSIYLLTGEARSKWQHMIRPVKEHRYSITFRTVRKARMR